MKRFAVYVRRGRAERDIARFHKRGWEPFVRTRFRLFIVVTVET